MNLSTNAHKIHIFLLVHTLEMNIIFNTIIILGDLPYRATRTSCPSWNLDILTLSLAWSCLTSASRAWEAGLAAVGMILPWQEQSAFSGAAEVCWGNVIFLHCWSSISRTFFCCSTPARSEVSFCRLTDRENRWAWLLLFLLNQGKLYLCARVSKPWIMYSFPFIIHEITLIYTSPTMSVFSALWQCIYLLNSHYINMMIMMERQSKNMF